MNTWFLEFKKRVVDIQNEKWASFILTRTVKVIDEALDSNPLYTIIKS